MTAYCNSVYRMVLCIHGQEINKKMEENKMKKVLYVGEMTMEGLINKEPVFEFTNDEVKSLKDAVWYYCTNNNIEMPENLDDYMLVDEQ